MDKANFTLDNGYCVPTFWEHSDLYNSWCAQLTHISRGGVSLVEVKARRCEGAEASVYDSWNSFHSNALDSAAKSCLQTKAAAILRRLKQAESRQNRFRKHSQLTMTSSSSLQSYTSLLSQKRTLLSMTFLS